MNSFNRFMSHKANSHTAAFAVAALGMWLFSIIPSASDASNHLSNADFQAFYTLNVLFAVLIACTAIFFGYGVAMTIRAKHLRAKHIYSLEHASLERTLEWAERYEIRVFSFHCDVQNRHTLHSLGKLYGSVLSNYIRSSDQPLVDLQEGIADLLLCALRPHYSWRAIARFCEAAASRHPELTKEVLDNALIIAQEKERISNKVVRVRNLDKKIENLG